MTTIILLISLSIIILVHEIGHFIAAKLNNIKVEEFGLGLPPKILSFKYGETVYSLNILPLGGFVKVYGEEEIPKNIKGKEKKRAFSFKKPWQKISVLIAGVIGNFLLGWVIISYLFTQGAPVALRNTTVINEIKKGSPAAAVHLQQNDIIRMVKIDERSYEIKSPTTLIKVLKNLKDKRITLFIDRGSKELKVEVKLKKHYKKGEGKLGVFISNYIIKRYPWYKAPFLGLKESISTFYIMTDELIKSILQTAKFKASNLDVTGPVGIVNYATRALQHGKVAYLEFIAILSLNLALINILPFPALDGGRVALVAYEWVTKKRVDKELERKINLFGIVFLMLLVILITIKDVKTFYLK